MKKIEAAWENAWDNIVSIDEVYRSYGVRSVVWCFRHLLLDERKVSILDVGCGAGFYFKFFKGIGFRELYGLEYDEGNIRKAEEINKGIMGFIKQKLRNAGVQTSKQYDLIPTFTLYRKSKFESKIKYIKNTLTLPMYPEMTWEDVECIVERLI